MQLIDTLPDLVETSISLRSTPSFLNRLGAVRSSGFLFQICSRSINFVLWLSVYPIKYKCRLLEIFMQIDIAFSFDAGYVTHRKVQHR